MPGDGVLAESRLGQAAYASYSDEEMSASNPTLPRIPSRQGGQPGPAMTLAASSSKLTNVEAQRILSVLQEMQKKVSVVALLPETLDKRLASILGLELASLLQEHRQLEQRYTVLLSEAALEKSGEPRQKTEMKEVARQLRNSARNVCRAFLSGSTGQSKLRYFKGVKQPALAAFESTLEEIKNLVYDRLRTTVEEEKAKQDQLSLIIAKELKTSSEVQALQAELQEARRNRLVEVNKRNEVIRRLKDELREIKSQAEESTRRMETKSKQKEDTDIKNFKEKEEQLTKEITALQNRLNETRSTNRETEAALRKRKFKIETEVENWIHKYDQDMGEKQNELEEITGIYTEEKSQLDELVRRFHALEKEYNAIMEERRLADEARKAQERLAERLGAAATVIQAAWRGYKTRKDLKNKKKKESKKKRKSAKSAKGGKGSARSRSAKSTSSGDENA